MSQYLTEYANGLSEGDLYDLITALRGPDVVQGILELPWYNSLQAIKSEVVCRLRQIAIVGFSVRGWLLIWGPNQTMKLQYNVAETKAWPGWGHFSSHLRNAVQATGNHHIWGGCGHDIVKILGTP